MAKKKVAKKVNWFALIPAFAAVAAIILATFLTGVRFYEESYSSINGSFIGSTLKTVPLLSFIFGSSSYELTTVLGSNEPDVSQFAYAGGVSTFGIIAFVLLALGVVAIVASLFIKGKKLDLIGSALIVLGGICLFLVLVAGFNVTYSSLFTEQIVAFKEFFEGFKLGAGVYICAILSILGGLFGAYTSLKAKK
ncbi:MAG: hypothetical protein IJZ73_00670 [Clostridia bacterium]|nr:hypothetical protein [Clostridia bacterium]